MGPSIAGDLRDLGISRTTDLHATDAEELYHRLCAIRGCHIDRCVLYVFRCAIYYATTDDPRPELLQWWNWKDSVLERAP